MFDFSVKGTVTGFNTLSDGRTIVKIQPEKSAKNIGRDERSGIMDIAVPANIANDYAMRQAVVVEGSGEVYFRERRDEKTGKIRSFANYRFEAQNISAVA
jgi:hypothetical protein